MSLRVVVLAGGLGTRQAEETERVPKPMVTIGGMPMLWHIMKVYAAADMRHFVVALGYKGEVVKRYFLDYRLLRADLSVATRTGEVTVTGGREEDWTVDLVDTGLETNTGGRVRRLAEWLPDDLFCLTYGDGLCTVDLTELVAFHRSQGRMATLTAIRPPSRFGGLVLDGPTVADFTEKPQIGEGWINGGFFVLSPEVLKYLDGDSCVWERTPLETLAEEGQLAAYQHHGFWQPMDTLRDKTFLEELWQSGQAPWKVWS
jgi:glucose-1-phosphate cytidylyltransferase